MPVNYGPYLSEKNFFNDEGAMITRLPKEMIAINERIIKLVIRLGIESIFRFCR